MLRSVMLYRFSYVKSTLGKGGMTTQEYVCSFPNHLTEIPTHFHEQLQRATGWAVSALRRTHPDHQTRVLAPARELQEAKRQLEELEQMRAWLTLANCRYTKLLPAPSVILAFQTQNSAVRSFNPRRCSVFIGTGQGS